MAFRDDLPYVQIYAPLFQEFDHGGEISQYIPEVKGKNLKVGDGFHWECGDNLDGIGKVVGLDGEKFRIKKGY